MANDPRARARQLAAEALHAGEPLRWFERLYAEAASSPTVVPWADGRPNPHLVSWMAGGSQLFASALVVGCGYGDDVAFLAEEARVERVVGFDLSPSAIEEASRRFRQAGTFVVADVFGLPEAWRGAFDLVVEAYTLQVLPPELRARAAKAMASAVAPGGTLLVVARGRGPTDDRGAMPWPLLREELDHFVEAGLLVQHVEDFLDDEHPPVRRFVASYRQPTLQRGLQ